MSNIINIKLADFIKQNYATYGRYVNLKRVIPGHDGLKPVYRRVLMGAMETANGKLAPTIAVLGEAQKYHPFGDKSTLDVISAMVRLNAMTGDGAFGSKSFPEDLEAAAPRYTECGLSKEQSDFYFRLFKYTTMHDGENREEPEFLITPVPLQLVHGGLNWGLGIMGRTPAFTYESLINAFYNDDYTLLESNFGYSIVPEKSDLKSLWEDGVGRMTLKNKVVRVNDDKVLMLTSGEIFKPALGGFKSLIEAGQIGIGNESGKEIAIPISRIPRARNVNMDEVYKMAVQASTNSRSYNILTVEDDMIRTIGIREWLTNTIGHYAKCFNQSKVDRIAEAEAKIEVIKVLPQVAKLIMDQKTDAEIMVAVNGLTEETLASIKRKSIGSLRRTDWEPELNSLTNAITSIKKEDPVEVIKSFTKSVFTK